MLVRDYKICYRAIISMSFILTCLFISCKSKHEIIYNQNLTDHINLLSKEENSQLATIQNNLIKRLEVNIVIVIKDSIEGKTIEYDTEKVYQQSILVQSSSQKWVLIVVCFKNRKIRIQFGMGLKNKLSDEECDKILKKDILPLFKQKKYYEGLKKGSESIAKVIEGV